MDDGFARLLLVLPSLVYTFRRCQTDGVVICEEQEASDRGLQSRAAGVTDGMTLAVIGRSNLTDPYLSSLPTPPGARR